MRVLIIANNCPWASWQTKIDAIKAFYAPLTALEIDIKYTDFENVPLNNYPGLVTSFVNGVAVDNLGTDTQIDRDWFQANIVPLLGGYDIAIFQLGDIAPQPGLPLGISFGEYGSTWCCESFVNAEVSQLYLPVPNGEYMINAGDLATVIIEHEISHALYGIALQHDRTHEFFYSGQFAKVLTDIVLPVPSSNRLITLYKQLVTLLQEELGILQAQSRSDPMPPSSQAQNPAPETTQAAKPTATASTTLLDRFCEAIKNYEGFAGPGSTLNGVFYPNGTPAYRNNNPGNCRYSPVGYLPYYEPVERSADDFAIFKDYATGWLYLENLVREKIQANPSATIAQFFAVYAPASDGNDPVRYAQTIAQEIGVETSFPVRNLLA